MQHRVVRTGARQPWAGRPPVRLSEGSTSDSTVFALPTLAVAYLPEDSPFVHGLGIFSLAGFGVDYPGSTGNPLFTAPPPAGLGFGPVHSEFQALQIVPALTYRATNRLSVAAGPTLTLATLRVEPGLFAAPDDANGDGFATYPAATHARTVVGGGFTVGVYYQADGWAAGASLKSPQWLDTFRFNARDEQGRPRDLAFNLDISTIVSVGGAYTGLEGWTFGLDVRYIDFANADGLEDQGVTPDGAVRGLGWRSIFAVAVGAQYRVGDKLAVRAGYSWNQNPVPNGVSFINRLYANQRFFYILLDCFLRQSKRRLCSPHAAVISKSEKPSLVLRNTSFTLRDRFTPASACSTRTRTRDSFRFSFFSSGVSSLLRGFFSADTSAARAARTPGSRCPSAAWTGAGSGCLRPPPPS